MEGPPGRQGYAVSPIAMFYAMWRSGGLIFQLIWRDVAGRYRGSVFGLLWSFFNPLVMLATYTFVFGYVIKARWGSMDSPLDFALFMFVGLIIHSMFAECINRASTLIVGNTSYVKKFLFPLEILVWTPLGSAFFHAIVSLLVFVAFMWWVKGGITWIAILLPLIWLPYILMLAGIAWFVAATAVFLRDVAQTTGLLTLALLFLSPVFYPLSALPDEWQVFLWINPLTFVIEQSRHVLLLGELPDWNGLLIYAVVASLVAWLGFAWFQFVRKGFADVL